MCFTVLLVLAWPGVARPQVDQTVFGPELFTRTTGDPNVFHETFQATEGAGQLELFNGGVNGASQVTSAWVVLNGKQILGPNDFKKRDFLLKVPVTLQAQNRLDVTLASAPGGYAAVLITQPSAPEDAESGVIADLAVTDLVLTPDRCAPQAPVTVHATVTNWGRQKSGPATLIFSVDGTEIARMPVEPLGVKTSAAFATTWIAQGPGRHRVSARVEAGAGMLDPVRANDSRLATLRVSGESAPVPELEFGLPQFHPAASGQPASVTVTVRNPSFADLEDIWLWFSVQGSPLPQETALTLQPTPRNLPELPCDVCEVFPDAVIAFLAAGASTEVEFRWPYEDLGQYVVQVTVGNVPRSVPMDQLVRTWELAVPGVLLIPSPIVETWQIGQPNWSPMGPYQITNEPYAWGPPNTGQITALVVHPTDSYVIYAAKDGGVSGAGIWGTADGGLTWYPLGDKFPHLAISAIAVDPKNPKIIYCATGGASAQGEISGYILKSIDGGNHWYIFAHPADSYRSLAVRYTSSGQVVVYAASNRGVLRYKSNTADSLASQESQWPVILDGHIGDMVVHPTDPNLVFAVLYGDMGVLDGLWRTTVGVTATGKGNWAKKLEFTLPNPDSYYMLVDLFRANPQKVHVLTVGSATPWNPEPQGELRISDQQGDNFTLVYSFPLECGELVNFLRAHPTVENVLYVGCDQNPGSLVRVQKVNTWSHWTIPNLHPDQHDLVFASNSYTGSSWVGYLLANDGGVYRRDYAPPLLALLGLEWFESGIPLNNGLVTADLYGHSLGGLDVSLTNPDVMIGGTKDNGVIIYQPNSGMPAKWKMTRGGDGYAVAIAPTDPKTMYSGVVGGYKAIERSQDGGDTWKPRKHLSVEDGSGPVFTDPQFANTIYLGGAQVQMSVDGGDNWYQIGPSSPQKKGTVDQVLRVTGVLCGSILYAGTSSGQLWAQFTDHCSELGEVVYSWELVHEHPDPVTHIVSMAVAPNNRDILFVAYGGGPSKDNRVRRFQFNYGSGNWGPGWWTSDGITVSLPQGFAPSNAPLELKAIAVHPTDKHTVFVGTQKGVFQGVETGQTWVWQPYNNSLPLVEITKLISIPLTGEIRAATWGRGVWTITPYTSEFE